MDSKYREDLFRKYVQLIESKLDASDFKQRPLSDDYLKSAASALLCLHHTEPSNRFRLIQFYEVAEKAMKVLKSSSLCCLRTAFEILETICINLILYPWKKEFRKIKTYTGAFMYSIKSAITEVDIKYILGCIGYVQDETVYKLKDMYSTIQVKNASFELFLARVECEHLLEIHSQVKDKGFSELDVLHERKNGVDDVSGCINALRRHAEISDDISSSMTRMILRKSASERGPKDYLKHKVSKPSKSVDTYDNHWESKMKPSLATPLPFKREPFFVEAAEDVKDEIIRPPHSLLTVSISPLGNADEFLNDGTGTNPSCNSYFPNLDDVDLYTDPDSRNLMQSKRVDHPKVDVWFQKNNINPSHHKRAHTTKETACIKCQNCGITSGGTSVCQNCDMILCGHCHSDVHIPHCKPDYLRLSKPSILTSRTPAVTSDNFYSGTSREKSICPPQDRLATYSTKLKPTSTVRCGFCNKVGASNTCTCCSKVSCDSCIIAYPSDICTRKNECHKFLPNSRLTYKSSQVSFVHR
ncbi:spermatogenesis-associated protein 2 [Protopterus annectens]|uniref:spermatogenesis-associated protein 2 n=1 Tax=Protopterus annectens TaxID=7888 RepID=UPI001CF9C306|nr:spermatogenesis-associated protein 2 [Protopterus annectens]XP_043945873.1 spermatogenesis-associated protein 2 [Protopterus annectens]XP_043945874.1 spermatogenesis-associated protein 2 [Protopterus annectens]XP_043945875.1 spermatogenesis-associated protein 2 [Protopterus annectens]